MNPETPSVKSVKSVDFSPKVSVIVPVYKVEKYLPECIESVLAQTFPDFELLLVDDGSPDNSGKICDDYAARDPRVRVFHKPNGGVTSARRLGVERSRAEWITFVDSDDIVAPDALSALLAGIGEGGSDTDIVEGRIASFVKSIPSNRAGNPRAVTIRRVGVEEYAAQIGNGAWIAGPFAKIFRKRLLSPWTMSVPAKFNVGEDMLMCLRAAVSGLRKAVKLSQCIYFYRQREGSAMHTFTPTDEYCHMRYVEAKVSLSGLRVSREAYSKICAYHAQHAVKALILGKAAIRSRDFWLAEMSPLCAGAFPRNRAELLSWAISLCLKLHMERLLAWGHASKNPNPMKQCQ